MKLLLHHIPCLRDLIITLDADDDESYWYDEEYLNFLDISWSAIYPTVELTKYQANKKPLQELPELRYFDLKGFNSDHFIRRRLEKFRKINTK